MHDFISAMQQRVDDINRRAKANAIAEQEARERALKASMDYISGIEVIEEPGILTEKNHA